MPPRVTRSLFLSACILLLWSGFAPADTPTLTDRGKKKLPHLFAEAVTVAADATVRLQCDGKDVALGTVVSADGYILTKGSELRGDVSCRLHDGQVLTARRVGYQKATDLALLKIDATGLKPVVFAPPTDVTVGNWVAVAGLGSEPVAVGVVSGPARKLYGDQAAIENGNKGYLGIAGVADAEDQAGVLVREVTPKGGAANAGLKPKDVIVELAGKAVKNRDALMELLDAYRPGDTVTVRVKRGEDKLQFQVKLGGRAEFDRSAMQNSMGGALSGRRTGFPAIVAHDTVIRPTDCGGPLVDLNGRVLGINIARAGRTETWALPGDVVRAALKELQPAK
jgi:serine protease Do